MHKTKEINIVVAMKREATPLINYWDLKENSKKFYSNKKKKNKFNNFWYREKKSRKSNKISC